MVTKTLLLLFVFTITTPLRHVELFGNNTLGYYYIEAFVGTPPQKKALILDTGSHLTIFPCSGCTHCRNHLYKIFNSEASSTFHKVNPNKSYFDWKCASHKDPNHCAFTQSYTEGSEYSGYFAVDTFLFENELNKTKGKSPKHVFGCAMKETNLFYSQEVDGIIGFGSSGLREGRLNSRWSSTNYIRHRTERRKDCRTDFFYLCCT